MVRGGHWEGVLLSSKFYLITSLPFSNEPEETGLFIVAYSKICLIHKLKLFSDTGPNKPQKCLHQRNLVGLNSNTNFG